MGSSLVIKKARSDAGFFMPYTTDTWRSGRPSRSGCRQYQIGGALPIDGVRSNFLRSSFGTA
jgi:hypothetical protein